MSSVAETRANPAPPPNTVIVGRELIYLDTVDSTNSRALESGPDGLVIVAGEQSAGRGRHGHTWDSAPGLGLWFSVALEGGADDAVVFAAALAIREALEPGCRAQVKWPNDLLIGGKKVCGILVERRGARTALGIGINVHHRKEDFPEPLRETATSLDSATGTRWNRWELLRRVLEALDRKVLALRAGMGEDIRCAWFAACGLEGKHVRCGATIGRVAGMDKQGALLIETDGRIRRISDGPVVAIDGD